jgi:hypothetical protein
MAPFVLPVAVVAALGGLYLYTRGPSAAEKAAAAKAAAAKAAPAPFPPELMTELTALLNAPDDQDPAALEAVAVKLEALGFKEQALSLRLKASKLRAAQSTPFVPGVF